MKKLYRVFAVNNGRKLGGKAVGFVKFSISDNTSTYGCIGCNRI